MLCCCSPCTEPLSAIIWFLTSGVHTPLSTRSFNRYCSNRGRRVRLVSRRIVRGRMVRGRIVGGEDTGRSRRRRRRMRKWRRRKKRTKEREGQVEG